MPDVSFLTKQNKGCSFSTIIVHGKTYYLVFRSFYDQLKIIPCSKLEKLKFRRGTNETSAFSKFIRDSGPSSTKLNQLQVNR